MELTKGEIEEILFCLEKVNETSYEECKIRTNLIDKLYGALDS